MRPEGFVSGNPNEFIKNRTRELPACSALLFYGYEKECKLKWLVNLMFMFQCIMTQYTEDDQKDAFSSLSFDNEISLNFNSIFHDSQCIVSSEQNNIYLVT